MTTPRVTATIDLSAIRHNLGVVRRLAPQSKVMAAIKADGYGHGAARVAAALAGVDALAVACLEEAVLLRRAGVQETPIAILEGILSAAEVRLAAGHNLQIVVHDEWQLELLRGSAARLWLKLDTRMHRLGFPAADAAALYARVLAEPQWQLQGWMTHLACADEPEDPMTPEQIARFDHALGNLPGDRSIANSAGIMLWPDARREWVRPGIMLYGASPLAGRTGAELGLQPAMRVESRLLSIRHYPAGAPIGYGATYRCPEAMNVGVVAVGYADGIHRALPAGTPLIVRGRRVPLVGRVSMDMLTVDLRHVPDAAVGDAVLLWGAELPAEEIARHAGTIAYELFCGLTRRVNFSHRK